MPIYSYVALDAHGKETKGTIEVASQNEAIGRVKEMGFFPTKIVEATSPRTRRRQKDQDARPGQERRQEGRRARTSRSRFPG